MRKILVMTLIGVACSAQAQLNKNVIMLEFFGAGIHNQAGISLNYERIFVQKRLNIYGRAGAGYWEDISSYMSQSGAKFNLGAGIFTGAKSHHLDLQGGADMYQYKVHHAEDPTSGNPSSTYVTHELDLDPYIMIGYRYQKPLQRFMFRIGVATYGANLAFGYSF